METTISGAHILVLSIFVWFLGTYLNRKISILDRYSIPVAVTGGLICSAVLDKFSMATATLSQTTGGMTRNVLIDESD